MEFVYVMRPEGLCGTYVGRTKDINKRVADHMHTRFANDESVEVFYYEVPDEGTMVSDQESTQTLLEMMRCGAELDVDFSPCEALREGHAMARGAQYTRNDVDYMRVKSDFAHKFDLCFNCLGESHKAGRCKGSFLTAADLHDKLFAENVGSVYTVVRRDRTSDVDVVELARRFAAAQVRQAERSRVAELRALRRRK